MSYTTINKVQAAAKNIDPAGTKTSTFTADEYTSFISWGDMVVNGKLSAVYYTPLQTINRAGNSGIYPDPIEWIATNLVAGWIVESAYSRIDPNISDAGKVHKENALRELDEICNGVLGGSRRLEGQVLRARNSFANPWVIPLEPPKNNVNF